MIVKTRPGVGEYAPPFAGYVARIADDEDIVGHLCDTERVFACRALRIQTLEERYTE